MSRRVFAKLALVAAVGLAAASAGSAETLLFTYTETGADAVDVSWEQSSNPTPIAYNYDTYTTVPVFRWRGKIGPFGALTYDSVVYTDGGFYTPDGAILVSHLQLYGTPESSPGFAPNVWTGVNQADNLPFTLTITAVPEPGAWAMCLLGLAAVGAFLRVGRRISNLRVGWSESAARS